MIRQVLRDPALQAELDEKGFVQVKLLSPEAAERLRNFYFETRQAALDSGFHSSLFSSNQEYKQKVYETIKEAFAEGVERYFQDCYTYVANFVVKEPGESSAVPPHQDWTMVDETEYRSLALWCPLVDTNPTNGNIGYVPGSHAWIQTFRGSPFIPSPFDQYGGNLRDKAVYIPQKAGDAIIYDNRTIHVSPPNLSDTPRVAAGLGLVPNGAELYHFYKNPMNPHAPIEKFLVDAGFFISHQMGDYPQALKHLGNVTPPVTKIEEAQMRKWLGDELPQNAVPEAPKGLLARLKQLFVRA